MERLVNPGQLVAGLAETIDRHHLADIGEFQKQGLRSQFQRRCRVAREGLLQDLLQFGQSFIPMDAVGLPQFLLQ